MECAVYDTYVEKKDGKTMHFDVVVEATTPHEKAIEYGKQYLEKAGQAGQKMTQEESNSVTFKRHLLWLKRISYQKDIIYRKWRDVLHETYLICYGLRSSLAISNYL